MTYPQAIRYLESLIDYERLLDWPYRKSFPLDRFRLFLEKLGRPEVSLRCIHVAGSKGKGSTCAFIAYILREAGFKVGLYTSPHLSDFRERIRILDGKGKPFAELRTNQRLTVRDSLWFEGMIPKKDLARLVAGLKPKIENYNQQSQYGQLTFFEAYTALAFVYFQEEKVDFAVLETGLGGRLDATNTAYALVSVITPISYEHTHLLGRTLREIAGEKAGIIKRQKEKGKSKKHMVISAPQERQAREVIANRCRIADAKLFEVGKDIRVAIHRSGVTTNSGEYNNLRLGLIGAHQLINAAAAIGAVEGLRNFGVNVALRSIRKGLRNTVWPGRCEVIFRQPLVVLDGAQNAASSLALKKAIAENFSYRRLILVLGVSRDKDLSGLWRELSPLADEIILTRSDNPRAMRAEEMEEVVGSRAIKTNNVKEAIKKALRSAGKKDLILVTGSLFVVGQVRSFIKDKYA